MRAGFDEEQYPDFRAAGFLTEQPKVLAIDGANFISEQSINHLVYVWNQAKNGIVLLGTDELQRVVKSSRLQRVRSRMKLMISLGGLTDSEVKDKLLESFAEKEVTAKVVELALIGSFGSYRDLETIIETANCTNSPFIVQTFSNNFLNRYWLLKKY